MGRSNRRTWAVASAVATVLVGHGRAEAALTVAVTPTVVADGLQSYTFSYRIANSPTSTVDAGAFSLVVGPTANLGSFRTPTGYLVLYTPGDPTIQFASTDASTDITPGSADTFSFVSAVGPAADPYSVLSYDDFETSNGTTTGPTAVPEPSAAAMAAAGAVALFHRRRRA